MKKIGVVALENINNVGDEFLGETTHYLIQKNGVDIKRIQLAPSFKELRQKGFLLQAISAKSLDIFSKVFLKGNTKYKSLNIAYKIRLIQYYQHELKGLDGIVYAVGMFKYSTQNFSYIFEIVNKIATDYNIPVLMSAMSVEKENQQDWRYHQLVRAVNMPSVKKITTRDGVNGVKRLEKSYIKKSDVKFDFVGDPALWIPDCYNTKSRKNSDVMGIGVIRENIYTDYGIDFSGEQLLEAYVSLIKELEKRNHKWMLFCNGMKQDYEFGQKILKKLNMDESKLLPAPGNGQQLVDLILGFKVVFGARLHACITSFALDVPVVGLLWDNKLREFSKTMKIEKFFCEVEDLKGSIIADKLEEAINFKYDVENREFYKQKTAQAISDFIKGIK